MNQAQVKTIATEVGHSLWVTSSAIILAFIVAAAAAGATHSVPQLIAFIKEQWLTVLLIDVIAPSIRGGHIALVTTKGQPTP